jgi:AcrR family transcriptional regulator
MTDQLAQADAADARRAHGTRAAREHRDETRSRIVAEALQLIADHGFAATSTREISERLGFTKAALYYHFRTKADLLAALVDPALHDLVDLVASATPVSAPSARRRIVERYVQLVAAHADLIRVIADDPSVRASTVLGPAVLQFRRLQAILAGTEEPDVAQRARVRAALGAVHATLLRGDPDDNPQTLRDTAVAVASAVLGLPAHRRTPAAE